MFQRHFRTTILAALVLLAFAVILPIATQAQRWGRRIYDPATEVTLKGVVQEVKTQTCQNCGYRGTGTHLVLKTDAETIEVQLGPSSFLQEKKYTFERGDQIDVTGSKVKLAGADVLIAREVKRGDAVMTLRDSRGIPEWRRGRRQP